MESTDSVLSGWWRWPGDLLRSDYFLHLFLLQEAGSFVFSWGNTKRISTKSWKVNVICKHAICLILSPYLLECDCIISLNHLPNKKLLWVTSNAKVVYNWMGNHFMMWLAWSRNIFWCTWNAFLYFCCKNSAEFILSAIFLHYDTRDNNQTFFSYRPVLSGMTEVPKMSWFELSFPSVYIFAEDNDCLTNSM